MRRYLTIGFLLVLSASVTSAAAVNDTVTVHRCIDDKGQLSLQDNPCPKGSEQTTLQLQRPKDPPPAAIPVNLPEPAKPKEAVAPVEPPVVEYRRNLVPPPPLYHCTSYDGIERYSEQYDPNPRCEPVALYYPNAQLLSPQFQRACHWVQDSCVQLSADAACEHWRQKKVKAASAAMHAFSDTAAYTKSELERTTQIVNQSCQ